MLVSLSALESTPESLQAAELSLEEENVEMAVALSQKFEEINLIRDFTERLRLDEDAATTCNALLELLKPCVACDTLAIDLFSVAESGTAGSMQQIGFEHAADLLRDISESAKQYVRSVTGKESYGDATVANSSDFPRISDLRVVVLPIANSQTKFGELIATRAREDEEFGTIEVDMLKSSLMMLAVQLTNQRQYQEMQQMFEGTVNSLVSALDAKDTYTCGHSSRVSNVSVHLAKCTGMSDEEVETVRMAAILHDIGKIGIDDAVLRKPGKLTDEEFDQIKRHPTLGYEILKGIRPFQKLLPAVLHHHESWDGTGYPAGLAGDEIPRDAQIVAVADAFDAMTSDRPYRNGMEIDRVVSIFEGGRGSQWAADIVDHLLADREQLARFAQRGADSKLVETGASESGHLFTVDTPADS